MNGPSRPPGPVRTGALAGTGAYLPDRVVDNDELSDSLGVSKRWIESRCGIRERRYAAPREGTGSMGATAAANAIARAGCQPEDIDFIIFATLSPDFLFPGSGCLMQRALGLSHVGILEIHNQCAGFIYALSTAQAFLASGQYERILVVCAEIHSRTVSLQGTTPEVAVLFGDGAAAVVLEARDEGGILLTRLHADGAGAEALKLDAPGRAGPSAAAGTHSGDWQPPFMDGPRVFRRAVREMAAVSQEIVDAAGLDLGAIDLVVPHQSNLRMIEAVRKRLGLDPARLFHNIETRGNTSAASIPLALHEAIISNRLNPGDLILLVAFGSGYTWGGALLRF